ncbi:MAG: arsenosugar biosynthesis radical SAM (seleno)protein ArsS [Melioribacteraceae bacterium]
MEKLDFEILTKNGSTAKSEFDFAKHLENHKVDISPLSVETLQVNITKLCNQACLHCHVDSSPNRTEHMDLRTIDKCLEILESDDRIKNLDITGGAPELHQHFRYMVKEARKMNKRVMVRHNLTVTHDPHPNTGESNFDLPDFFAEQKVELISSLPYYQEYFTDKQRGRGVFEKSIDSLKMLNAKGYGKGNPELTLDLVYNPVGAFLPASQCELKEKFEKELSANFDITFDNLFVVTNMPIHRFKKDLERRNGYEDYLDKLVNAFNPIAAEGVMCRSMISVSYDGKVYDCDFNQMLEMQITNKTPQTIFDFDYKKLLERKILVDSHCFGCTAGAGSSCGGETA